MAAPLQPVNPNQVDRYRSPWPTRVRVGLALWWVAGLFIRVCPLNRVRVLILKAFGARIEGIPYVHRRARIWAPWNLEMEDRACLGDRVDVYNLAPIRLRRGCTVAQQSYLCAGTHSFETPTLALMAAPIVIGEEAFLGARTFVLPGVEIGTGAITGACAVVTRDVPAGAVVAGNPARVIRQRSA